MNTTQHRPSITAIVATAVAVAASGGSIGAGAASSTAADAVQTSVSATSDAVAATSVASSTETAAVDILPPDQPWDGLTRGEWDARWFQWTVSLPVDVNPALDTTGERCGYGQSGSVFFLPVNADPSAAEGGDIFAQEPPQPVERTCVVAEGTAIYANPVSFDCSTAEPPPFFGRTEDELRACANAWLDKATDYQASINGHDVGDLEAYRSGSPLFTLTFPENNLFGAEPVVAQAVSAAYSFIIAPPPPGEYKIVLSTRYLGHTATILNTVNLIVEAPEVIEPPTT